MILASHLGQMQTLLGQKPDLTLKELWAAVFALTKGATP